MIGWASSQDSCRWPAQRRAPYGGPSLHGARGQTAALPCSPPLYDLHRSWRMTQSTMCRTTLALSRQTSSQACRTCLSKSFPVAWSTCCKWCLLHSPFLYYIPFSVSGHGRLRPDLLLVCQLAALGHPLLRDSAPREPHSGAFHPRLLVRGMKGVGGWVSTVDGWKRSVCMCVCVGGGGVPDRLTFVMLIWAPGPLWCSLRGGWLGQQPS